MPELRDRTFNELVSQLGHDLTLLIRQELLLAKTEIREKISRATRSMVSLAGGAAVAWAGGVTLVAGVILVLIQVIGLPAWGAAVAVGGVLGIAGLVMIRAAVRNLHRIDPTPYRTVKSIERDIQWVKEQP